MGKLRVGVLISGSGSNLQSIIDHCEAGKLSATVEVVISNNKDAFGLERARRHRIPAVVVDHRKYKDRLDFEKKISDTLDAYGVELVALAGFMRVLTPFFVQKYRWRLMNIHPALLPSFPGIQVQKKALEYGVRFSGCTVHFVDEGTDTGPIIIQAVVPVLQDDTPQSLAERILREEHKIYPKAIQLFAEGRLEVKGRRVFIKDYVAPPDAMLMNPSYDLGLEQ